MTSTTETRTTRPGWVTAEVIDRLSSRISRSPDSPDVIEPVAPYDGEPIAEIKVSTTDDVTKAVARARRAQDIWATRSDAQRADVVLRFHDLLVERQDEVIDLIQLEVGKARFSAWQEILQVGTIARHYARKASSYLADTSVRGAIPGLTKVREVRVPKGVVGIISPWNYPLYLGVGDVIPALLAGNAVVSKADSQTPLTLLWAHELMEEAGLPQGLWNIVAGSGRTIGTALIDEVDYVCFTGSTATGRTVGSRAGNRLIGCSLELGGKNPLIVRADADIEKAVQGTISAAFGNSGQMCIHIERVIVHTDLYGRFRDALVTATKELPIGQTYDYDVEMGTLVSKAQLRSVKKHVDQALKLGATVLAGGKPRPDIGPFAYEPTILEGVNADMAVCLEETFGPVVSLYRVQSDTEAIDKANEGSYGLSASIWSEDTGTAEWLARQVRSGAVNINDGAAAAAGSIEAPMGGMGDSGLGRRHGAEGIRKYTESQTIATQRVMPIGVPPNMTVEGFIELTTKQMRALRKLRVR